jgi:hypothetical protein
MSALYRNPWYKSGRPEYGPYEYITDSEPQPYRGMNIYQRLSKCFDVVWDDVCIGQYAGQSGAVQLIDSIRDKPTDYWAARAIRFYEAQK